MANGYHIYIHLGELSGDSAMAGDSSSTVTGGMASEKGASDAQRAAKKLVSYATAKTTAMNIVSGTINQVELSTGASEYQQRLQANFSVAQQLISAGETIVAGAMTGGIYGAIAGMIVSGVQTGINFAQRASQLRKQESLEDISIGMKNIRVGVAGRRGKNQ